VTWEPLPRVPDTDPAARLLAQRAGPPPVALSLYGDGGRANRDAARRRAADDVLAKHGVRPRPLYMRGGRRPGRPSLRVPGRPAVPAQ
jgi:hypothetical protein